MLLSYHVALCVAQKIAWGGLSFLHVFCFFSFFWSRCGLYILLCNNQYILCVPGLKVIELEALPEAYACAYMYIYTHPWIYIYTHSIFEVNVNVKLCIQIQYLIFIIFIDRDIHVIMQACTRIRTCLFMHIYVCNWILTCIRTCALIYIFNLSAQFTCTRIRTHYAYVCMHIYALMTFIINAHIYTWVYNNCISLTYALSIAINIDIDVMIKLFEFECIGARAQACMIICMVMNSKI
jgi:hypothetical protein